MSASTAATTSSHYYHQQTSSASSQHQRVVNTSLSEPVPFQQLESSCTVNPKNNFGQDNNKNCHKKSSHFPSCYTNHHHQQTMPISNQFSNGEYHHTNIECNHHHEEKRYPSETTTTTNIPNPLIHSSSSSTMTSNNNNIINSKNTTLSQNSLSFFEFLDDDSSSSTTFCLSSSSSSSVFNNHNNSINNNFDTLNQENDAENGDHHQRLKSSPRNPSTPPTSRPKSLSILSFPSSTAMNTSSSTVTNSTNVSNPVGTTTTNTTPQKNVDWRRSLKRLANHHHSSSASSLASFSSREHTPPQHTPPQSQHFQHYSPHNIHQMYQNSSNAAGQGPPVVSLPSSSIREYPYRVNSATSPTSSSVIRVYSPPGEDEDSVSNQSSQNKTNRSSFSSLNSSMIFEDDNIYDFTSSIGGRSIHLIHLLLHPTTKALFKDYCEKIRVLELFDCLESIRLYYVAIDTFKSEAHKKKIDDMRLTLNLNNNSISVDDLMVSGMTINGGDTNRKQDTKKKRVSLSSSNSKTFKSKRQSVALLFNNNNLLEALQQKLNADMGLDSYSQSLSGLFTLGGNERDQIHIEDISKENREILKQFEKSDTWLSFVSNPAHKDIVAQVLDYSNSVWGSNNCQSGLCYTKFTKKEFVRDNVNIEDYNFLKQVIFSYHGRNWQTLKPTTKDSPFSIYYSKGKYYVDQEALGIKFGCFKETANLPFSAEEVLSAMHSKLVQSILDESLNVDATLFCLKTIPHRYMEGILPGNVTKLAINLPIVLSNQRCCYQALSIMYDPTTERYYSFSKPILFNENYTFSDKDVQGILINMMCVERVTDTSCKYSNVTISNFGGILKNKVFKKVPLKRAKNVQALLFEQLNENRNNLFNNVRDGYEMCLDLLSRYSTCSNIAIPHFPKSFGELQEKFCGYF
nr:unnamed protein product [Naegleria fowleri]